MDIKQLKKELGLSNKDIAKFFNMEYHVYANSTAKKRYENALIEFHKYIKLNKQYNKQFKCGNCENNCKELFYFDSYIGDDEIFNCSVCKDDLRISKREFLN